MIGLQAREEHVSDLVELYLLVERHSLEAIRHIEEVGAVIENDGDSSLKVSVVGRDSLQQILHFYKCLSNYIYGSQ